MAFDDENDENKEGTPAWKKARGYAKWATTNTSTVPNDPANEINRAKGEPQKAAPSTSFSNSPTAGPVENINDGTTDIVVSHLAREKALSQVPDFGGQPEKQHYPPCINPTCRSMGKSHPNCLCYSGGGSEMEQGFFAKGGRVCSGPHRPECEHYAEGGEVEQNMQFLQNPSAAVDHVASQEGLLNLLTKVGQNGRSENPNKHVENYIDSYRRGHQKLDSQVEGMFDKQDEMSPDKKSIAALKDRLQNIQENPSQMMDIGGSLAQTLPDHSMQIAAKAANAVEYLKKFKPNQAQNGPFDNPQPLDKQAEAHYDRQLAIAQNPMLVLQHVKRGTVQPSDVTTLRSLYPELAKSMASKAFDSLVTAKSEGKAIPYRHRQGLSELMGQPLDGIQTPQAMQAIMKANAPAQRPQTPGVAPKKASNVELKQIDKTNQLSADATQQRQLDKKS